MMAVQAWECFFAQTYEAKQLVILDDEQEPSFPVFGVNSLDPDGVVIYIRIPDHLTIAMKRNLCCRAAHGEIIAHWDSDDWSAPERLTQQVEELERSGKAVTGYHSMLFCDGVEVHHYTGLDKYAIGTSLCYRKSWWESHPFAETEIHNGSVRPRIIGEDNQFSRVAFEADEIVTRDAKGMMVARIHAGNTSRKHLDGWQFRKHSIDELPPLFPR